jgi:hypothetical protein
MENSFFGANLMALGGQMAQAWQKLLDAWWQGLLGDRERLRDLARGLAEASKDAKEAGVGVGVGVGVKGAASAEDLAQVIEALELIERRQKALEEQLASLTGNVSAVVTFLERSGVAPAARGVEQEGDAGKEGA